MAVDRLSLLSDLVARARRMGADAADAVFVQGDSFSVARRLGKSEGLERSEGMDLGLRVFFGKRQASVSSSDAGPSALTELVERAVAMAKAVPEDPHCGLAAPDLLAKAPPDLDLFDGSEPSAALLEERAAAAEDAARAVAGVTNSEGADASWGRSGIWLVTSTGFAGHYQGSSFSVSAAVLAGAGTLMERDYDFTSARFLADLDDAVAVGRRAGERAVARLHPRKVPTCKVPVVFDPRVANSLLRHLVGAISGPAITRGTSFLKDRLGQSVFAPSIRVTDDPHRRRGLASKPFDGEGVANRARDLVAGGVLQTWLLDVRSANQLGLTTTGHAARGTSAPPSPAPTNLYLAPGRLTPEALVGEIAQGFYVTELIGMGVNGVTGDYSRGAAGFWISQGVRTHAVSELTIAGNLKDMFKALTPADDLVFRYGTNAPTVRIDGMTIAGV
ncbi:MAG: TldD/PmbA family protein [Alphaproteobacteria bacterium]|nr:TldD/PmbA family protein [Alphaproteobacteria bacterium]